MHRRSRRQFLQGGAALASLGLAVAGCGIFRPSDQPAVRVHRVGYLTLSGDERAAAERLAAFRDGLRDLGYLEGQNLVIEVRRIDGPEGLPELAAELTRLPVDVIVASPTQTALAAKKATSTIPIVFPLAVDPIELGLVESLARPGGNVTGLTQLSAELAGKRLELLKETVPSLARVAVLWTATSQPKVLEHGRVQEAAQVLGLQVQSLPVRDPSEVAPALESALSSGTEVLVPLSDPLVGSRRTQVIEFATQHRLPTVFDQRDFVEVGGLLSYGANITDLFRRAATYVDKILRGTKPADLPVERPTKFDLIINLRTARALGLAIPQPVLLQATEVIE